ncbi:uncharacterized protein EI97DRAFT_463947 [Westerdykella ornata]|uniref:Telomeric single stranded DNA binding POT1/Cdc13 domain-containing protein n=1 Tax=Westerdykella ornata TaxID=318751 RepID=A0A6A6JTH7_WESOR|nr:uncharacterized protein EI97DRAFT_463947 [Westerdykella ornata]KAF2279872.1 hypothetical protein EI97DRAFT_463947 [Westerdykella ornata]
MDHLPIAEVTPELSDLETKQIQAIVTLIWPFSSSTRQCAILLAEPDFRLRHRKGQVRVRFTGPSAKAIAETGVGIGDEVSLGLRGARFMEEDVGIVTPGRSIEWELSYSRTIVAEIRRKGSSIAKLDILDAAPTPTPGTPVRPEPMMTPLRATIALPDMNQRWSSPAFVKRARLSGGLSFEAGFDPLRRDLEDGPEKKRRRKSYRDWSVWQYVPRTPSPEKEEYNAEDDLSREESPSRSPQVLETPTSIRSPEHVESNTLPEIDLGSSSATDHGSEPVPGVREDHFIDAFPSKEAREESAKVDSRNADYYDLYAGPDEIPPDRYAYGGDTESDTEKDESDHEHGHPTHVDIGAIGSVNPKGDISLSTDHRSTMSRPLVNQKIRHEDVPLIEEPEDLPKPQDESTADGGAPDHVMPPPKLAPLHTSFQTPSETQLLTPVGQQPRSPVIMPQDSSTLPMPSPFPGDREGHSLPSYFDTSSASHLPNQEPASADLGIKNAQEAPREGESIVESSFWSSVNTNSNKTHESDFTDVRFPFGVDGAAFSHQKEPSPFPEPEEHEITASPKSPEVGDKPEHREELAEEVAEQIAEDVIEELREELQEDLTENENEELEHELREEFREEFVDDFAEDLEEHWPQSVQGAQSPLRDVSGKESEFPEAHTKEMSMVGEQDEPHQRGADSRTDVIMISSDTGPGVTDDASQDESGKDHRIADAGEQSMARLDTPGEPERHSRPDEQRETVTGVVGRFSPSRPTTEIVDLGSPSESETSDEEDVRIDRGSAMIKPSEPISRHSLQVERFASDSTTMREVSHTDMQQAFETLTPGVGEEADGPSSEAEPPSTVDMRIPQDQNTQTSQTPTQESYPLHPDIKMESVEEETAVHFPDSASLYEDAQSVSSASEQLLIAVPEGHKMGELQYKSVAASGPARNTRSRTKQSTSSVKGDVPSIQSDSRSRRSRTSNVSSNLKRDSRSTASPARETKSTSPYQTRSQSKMLSPAKPRPEERKSPRKKTGYTSESFRYSSPANEGASQLESFHYEYSEFPDSIFEPSQELGTLQGRFRNVRSVKDSEEGSLHSENSLTTMPMSDDNGGYGVPAYFNYSDPVQPTSPLGPPSGQRDLDDTTPKAGEGVHISTLPPSSSASPRLEGNKVSESVLQKSLLSSTMPITPDGTQGALSQSQGVLGQLEHTLPLSPQLTQKTSAVSFGDVPVITKHKITTHEESQTFESQPALVSQVSTPSIHSEDLSDSEYETETLLVGSLGPPSIGLSTPISYYTPLRDLTYFLNRSSQFHTSSDPDILALVTSATTPAKRAHKPPKHYGTTLHITDLSIFPDSTSVQIFRPFSSALPIAQEGDIILLRSFQVKSLNRKCMLVSGEESAWCVWRWGKPVWGVKKTQAFGEVRAREEVRGPAVEMGEGEWREVERLRGWWVGDVRGSVGEGKEGKEKRVVENTKTEEGRERVAINDADRN